MHYYGGGVEPVSLICRSFPAVLWEACVADGFFDLYLVLMTDSSRLRIPYALTTLASFINDNLIFTPQQAMDVLSIPPADQTRYKTML